MENPKYDEPDYEEYPEYPGLGLPTTQLALIIGVNAVISLIISVGVVLLINWQVAPTVAIPTATQTVNAAAVAAAIEPTLPIAVEATSPQNTPESVIYQVQSGDSLSRIATKFQVPVFDLMLANGLTNEDFIQVDQKLIIPVGGLPTPTATFTAIPPTPTEAIPFDPPTALPGQATVPPEPMTVPPTVLATPNPLPTITTRSTAALPTATSTPADFNGIVITINDVVSAGTLAEERLSITNLGTGTSLKGWTLEGSPIGTFSFPDIFIFSGGTIRIHTQAGQSTPSDLYLNQSRAAWPIGTVVILRDDKGAQISTFKIQ